MSVPKGVQFKTIKPQGVYQEYRDYYVTPVQTYGNVFSVSDIVRLQFNLQDWYIDPYESFIEAEVGLQDETKIDFTTAVPYDGSNKVQFCMMDGPSTSLINDFRLEVNSKEIERIREYDQVGCLLTDLNMYPEAVDQKDYEGYYSIRGNPTSRGYDSNVENSIGYSGSATAVNFHQDSYNVPLVNPRIGLGTAGDGEPWYNHVGISVTDPTATSASGADLNLNNASVIRYERSAVGYTGAVNTYCVYGNIGAVADAKIGGGVYGSQYNQSSLLGKLTVGNSNFGISHDRLPASLPTSLSGGQLYCPDSPKMSQIDGHNIFLTNLPTSKITNGKFNSGMYGTSDYNAQTRAYMQIPLLSGVMGVLIPSDRW